MCAAELLLRPGSTMRGAPRTVCAAGSFDHNSATGTRTRVARVRAEYPNQLDYSGAEVSIAGAASAQCRMCCISVYGCLDSLIVTVVLAIVLLNGVRILPLLTAISDIL